AVFVVQGDRAGGAGDQGGLAAGAAGQVRFEERGVAEGGGHAGELGSGEFEQGHLPGPAAVGFGVEVELVGDDRVAVEVGAFAEGEVGEDLGGAADQGRVGVDRGVGGEHADVGGGGVGAPLEELLGDERFDGRGVEGGALVGQGVEVRGGGDERLARPGGGAGDDVGARADRQEGLLLVVVEVDALVGRPGGEGGVDVVGFGPVGVGQVVDEAHTGQWCQGRSEVVDAEHRGVIGPAG